MPGRQFFESPIRRELAPGTWQRDVEIDLQSTNFKSAATNWEYRTALQNRDQTVQLTFMINYGDAGKGTVWIDRARFDSRPDRGRE